jgi:hypothetical protein
MEEQTSPMFGKRTRVRAAWMTFQRNLASISLPELVYDPALNTTHASSPYDTSHHPFFLDDKMI